MKFKQGDWVRWDGLEIYTGKPAPVGQVRGYENGSPCVLLLGMGNLSIAYEQDLTKLSERQVAVELAARSLGVKP